eukprot:gnl/TRDRNA2_/TRDRNA2_176841_c0_seq15.p1 gnl/TRDRNA2_/TRDRNA2_176841_c0~~gnl/TRDRNA2_/TRDRNA2_176841_c0_seq15.p1  ORF type:complete len:360 (+),score=89.57 gnl/TRDRNA2_/TRDRNA2_176841_c0_seq15:76-1155(+)
MAPKDELKERFKSYDKNGDGTLDFNEMCVLLRQGHPDFTDKQVHMLFSKVDKDNSGTVSFEEFVDFIHSTPMLKGRRDKDAPVGDDGSEGDWDAVKKAFDAFSGKDKSLDGKEFAKIMVDCKLYDKKFTKNDVDIVFAKVVVKGKRRIEFDQFQNALRHVADKKGVSHSVVMEAVAGSGGPVIHATKADAVKFHDDKSTYTGAHTANDKHGGAGGNETESERHERLKKENAAHADDSEGDWGPVNATFKAYTEHTHGKLDGVHFGKLCVDCKLYDKKYTKNDVDLIFASVVTKGQRALDSKQFEDAVRKIAAKKGCPVSEVQQIIGDSGGPVLHGTEADKVRFHDDKSTYTGAHVGRFS